MDDFHKGEASRAKLISLYLLCLKNRWKVLESGWINLWISTLDSHPPFCCGYPLGFPQGYTEVIQGLSTGCRMIMMNRERPSFFIFSDSALAFIPPHYADYTCTNCADTNKLLEDVPILNTFLLLGWTTNFWYFTNHPAAWPSVAECWSRRLQRPQESLGAVGRARSMVAR